MKTFAERRSIRKYSQRPVPGELIESLAAGASRAATMGNMQLYSLVVTTDLDMKSRLADAHHRQPMVVRTQDMERFMQAVHATDSPRFYLPSELTALSCGRKIRIIGGSLHLCEGKLLTIRGSKVKRLLVELPGLLSVGVEVKPEYIEFVD